MSPRPANAEQGQHEILEAAAVIVAEQGFHGMSMRDLARATSRSLSSLYHYFPSKHALLAAIHIRAFDSLNACARDACRPSDPPSTRLYAFIYQHVRYVVEHPAVMRVLVGEAGALLPTDRALVRQRKEAYFEILRAIVADVLLSGCHHTTPVPEVAGVDVDRATYNLFGMINWIYAWYEPEVHGSVADVSRSVHSLALCGLVTQCPQRPVQDAAEPRLRGLMLHNPLSLRVSGDEQNDAGELPNSRRAG